MGGIDKDLRAIARGDRDAFTRLYRALRADFVRYATGVLSGDRAGAEDAVDDAFVAIWTEAGRYDGTGNAQGWMRRIVRNKAIDWLRKQREVCMSGEAVMADHANRATDAPSPLDCALHKDSAAALRNSLSLLSFDQREAVWLCYFEDMSIKDIAAVAGCPENTVKTRLFHARQRLAAAGHLKLLQFA